MMTKPDPSGFSRSPFNPSVSTPTKQRVILHDLTLREGEQAAQVAFSLDDRVAIAGKLADAGVPRVQMGFAGRDDEAVKAVKAAAVKTALSVLCVIFDDGWRRSVDAAVASRVDAILLLFRASDEQLAIIGLTREGGRARVREAVRYAVERIPVVVFQPSFATAADPAYLQQLCHDAAEAGAHEVAPCDTTGVVGPEGAARLVQVVGEVVDVPIAVHFHDDYGLALANSLAAVKAGASVVEASVLGLGERAGNCALEEIGVALEGLYGTATGLDLAQLTPLARFVAVRAGMQVGAGKAVVGGDVFTQKLDIHVRVTSKRPWLHEPFDPAKVGQVRALKLGRGSGPYAVQAKLAELGLEIDDARVARLVEFVNRQAVSQKDAISDSQLIAEVRALGKAAGK